MKGTIKIDLGCGDNPQPGFKGLDIRDIKNIDYPNTDVRALSFEDDTVDVLFASHVIEHFTKEEGKLALKEWCRVLKRGGELHIKCPNFYYIAEEYFKAVHGSGPENKQRKLDILNWTYGEQNYEYNYHYFAYDPITLKESLWKAGFEKVESRFPIDEQNIYLVGYK